MKRLFALVALLAAAFVPAAAAQVNTFTIASQAPMAVTFSVSVADHNAPNLNVANTCLDGNDNVVFSDTEAVGGWFSDNGSRLVGYASFSDVPSGYSCYATLDKPNGKTLAVFSYFSE